MVNDLMEKLDQLPFDWSPAARAAWEEIGSAGAESEAPELQRCGYQGVGGIVEVEQDEAPNFLASSGTNFEFVQGRVYPDERVEDADVVLQVGFDPDDGYEARVFLRGDATPDKDVRRRVLKGLVLDYFRPRRDDDRYFLRDTEIKALETDWLDEDDFREAVQEALRVCVLAEWERSARPNL